MTHARLAVQSELGWLFREQDEDYGIDAQVEVVDGETVRGKLLALQIKGGRSLFREPGPGGWWFRPKAAHVQYWTNHSLPVAVILYDPDTNRCHWQLVNSHTLKATPGGGSRLLVPKAQVLDKNAREALCKAAEGVPFVVRVHNTASHPSDQENGKAGTRENRDNEGGLTSDVNQKPITIIDVTPSPRFLLAAADAVAEPWMCVAELVEVAYDSTRGTSAESSRLSVDIALPSLVKGTNNGLVVRHNSLGMDLNTLIAAVRGSFTGYMTGPSFGLFLMLTKTGRRFMIRTSRASDPSWIEVTFDLLEADAFTAQICRVAKEEPNEHGMEITISGLYNERWRSRLQRPSKIGEQLGDCYSFLLSEGRIAITLDGKQIRPRRPCIWDAGRVVVRHGTSISAVQEINQKLPIAWVCRSCTFHHRWAVDVCSECLGRDIVERPRRIWGWLGAQRYIHQSDFGIDFIRNGRKILFRDKRLFMWANAADSVPVIEYPVDLPMAGRIVGEIHCDHVPVNLAKDSFDYGSREWSEVVHAVRGSLPLSLRRCKILGYAPNDSPLARLFNGFRRNDAGARYLTPGDGQSAIHEQARQWADRFRRGDPDFLTDRIWYEAVLSHDKIKSSNQP